MVGAIKLPFRWIAWRLHWCRHADLRERGEWVALTPRPPDRHGPGERADAFRERILHLVARHTSPPETPEWMLPANVDEFLARTRPGE